MPGNRLQAAVAEQMVCGLMNEKADGRRQRIALFLYVAEEEERGEEAEPEEEERAGRKRRPRRRRKSPRRRSGRQQTAVGCYGEGK